MIDSRAAVSGARNTLAKLIPSIPAGIGSPAISLSVGKMSTVSTKALVRAGAMPGAEMSKGMRAACS